MEKIFSTPDHEYYIDYKLSVARFKEVTRLQWELGLGIEIADLYKRITRVRDALTSGNDILGSHYYAVKELNELRAGVKQLETAPEKDKVLRLCALAILRKDENKTEVDEVIISEKIKDWIKHGDDMSFFFNVAKQSINRWKEIYSHLLVDENKEKIMSNTSK